MLFRLPGAFVRAALVVILIVMPFALLPQHNEDTVQIVALAALFGGLFAIVEYAFASPSLVEFRDAPPYNRVRFAALFAATFCIAVIFRGAEAPSEISDFFQQSGAGIGQAIDFPYSPVRLMIQMMPEGTDPATITRMRDAAGLCVILVLLSLIWFILLLRLSRWPRRTEAFNVWINLPTFDPTAGGDVVKRLRGIARFNVLLGILLPFLVPGAISLVGMFGTPISLDSVHTLVWIMVAWAFLPANILMRGIAISRVAYMIQMQRNRGAARVDFAGTYVG